MEQEPFLSTPRHEIHASSNDDHAQSWIAKMWNDHKSEIIAGASGLAAAAAIYETKGKILEGLSLGDSTERAAVGGMKADTSWWGRFKGCAPKWSDFSRLENPMIARSPFSQPLSSRIGVIDGELRVPRSPLGSSTEQDAVENLTIGDTSWSKLPASHLSSMSADPRLLERLPLAERLGEQSWFKNLERLDPTLARLHKIDTIFSDERSLPRAELMDAHIDLLHDLAAARSQELKAGDGFVSDRGQHVVITNLDLRLMKMFPKQLG